MRIGDSNMKLRNIFYILLISTLFIPVSVFAKNNDIVIKSIELLNKSENVEELSSPNTADDKINVGVKLYDPRDYIEYSILIKNNSNEDYSFDNSSLKITDDYLSYEFSYSESTNVLKPSEERYIKLKITYVNKVPASKLTNNAFESNNTLSLTLVDNTITPSINNPETGVTNPFTLILFMSISLIVIFIILKINKKCRLISLIISLLVIIPLYVSANKKIELDVNANIIIDGKEAYLITGKEFNIKAKELAGNDTSVDTHNTLNNSITSFMHSTIEPTSNNKEQKNIVSVPESEYPIYIWIDNGVLYWWSEDKSPNMNIDSSNMFRAFSGLQFVDGLTSFDSSNVENLGGLFSAANINNPMNIQSILPLKNWDVSKVTDITGMLQANYGLTSLEGLENWDTQNIKNMKTAFAYEDKLTSLKPLKNWNTSSVENLSTTFANLTSLESLEGLENWDTSNVKIMKYTFLVSPNQVPDGHTSHLKDISAVKNWNTSNVEDMLAIFQHAVSLESLDALSNWDTSKVPDFRSFCSNCKALTDASALYHFNTSSATTFAGMLGNATSLEEFDLTNYDFRNIASTSYANIFNQCSSLKRIKTPKYYPTNTNVKIKLPATFEDEDGNQYTELDNTSPTEVWLTKVV